MPFTLRCLILVLALAAGHPVGSTAADEALPSPPDLFEGDPALALTWERPEPLPPATDPQTPDPAFLEPAWASQPTLEREPARAGSAPRALPGRSPPPTRAEASGPSVDAYPVHDRPEVEVFLERFQRGRHRELVQTWLGRAGRYLGMIRDVLARNGLPEDLLFTAMIESGFNPVAVSRAGAKGMWQFMAPTARRYGLRVDKWIDERLDPERSTLAAVGYLKDLYAMFGHWHLALAAYNAGEMRILRAIQAMRTRDFWELTGGDILAEETKRFVAQIQAAVVIGREPERFGFAIEAASPLRYDLVTAPPGTQLRRVAAVSGVPLAALEELNGALRLRQTPPGETYALKVPPGTAGRVERAMKPVAGKGQGRAQSRVARAPARDVQDSLLAKGVHVVRPRETVGAIARRYGVSVAELLRWNNLDETARIAPGDRLRVAWKGPPEREEGQGGFR